MRRSSAVILVSASTVTLGAGWLVGSGYLAPAEVAPTAAPPTVPDSNAVTDAPEGTGAATQAPAAPVPVTVDGAIIDTKYGTVQVQVVIEGDVITDVIALKLTDSGETSIEVSARAAPILREEILAAQSTAVDNVSGATFTSEAYRTSVQSALDAAGFTG
ncbi:FMN-binding protein [Agromyces sp. NPDC049794]|uniref:FMN-binding protein n=1 Tax=unclassified Agromyces TaxID=2639701 RepID=UPI0033E13B34